MLFPFFPPNLYMYADDLQIPLTFVSCCSWDCAKELPASGAFKLH